jgi:hypothetical protein
MIKKTMTKEEAKRLEANTRQFLKLMNQGNYGDARLVIGLLESATYTLDAAWMKAYQDREGRLL